MFRGKYLSTVLLLSVLSNSWAVTPDFDVDIDSDQSDNSNALSYIGTGVVTVIEGLTHAMVYLATSSPGQTDANNFSLRLLNYTPLAHLGVNSNFLFRNNILISQALRLLPLANDYVCGMITITLEDGWYIERVRVDQGSIQNDSQFNDIGDNHYVPKNRGLTNLLLVKQMTGWTTASNVHYKDNPIDLYLTISDGSQTSDIKVQKNTCTSWSYGKAHASVVKGDDVSFCLTNVQTDPNVSSLSSTLTPAYGKPALMRIPGEACESFQ